MKTSQTRQNHKMLSRKFLVTSIVLIIAIILVLYDKISGSEFLTLITANAGVYSLSNALSKGKSDLVG